LILGIVAAAVFLLFAWREYSFHRLTLHAYYRHVQNVRKGMPVCVDGVEVGSVANVTVRPELGDRPVEVVLKVRTPYELRIPRDSIAALSSQGVLGPNVVDIDTRAAHAPPVTDGATIESRESTDDQAAHALGVVVKSLAEHSRKQDQQQTGAQPAKPSN
jgi:ABC-type transporter Mla subunit MlaD